MIEKKNLRAIVIDDELGARETLTGLLREFFVEVEVVAVGKNGIEGKELIEQERPDLIFLDVEMPGLSGIEMLKQVEFRDFEVVFVTAHRSYSLDAIKLSALDFLLKPVGIEDLELAIRKARERKYSRFLEERLQLLEEHLQGVNNRSMRIALPGKSGLEVVDVASIVRCEAESNYTHFFFENGQKQLVAKTLREYEKLLEKAGFFRIYQSHLVNLYHVKEYVRGRGGQVKMTDGAFLNVSRDRKKEFLSQLGKLS